MYREEYDDVASQSLSSLRRELKQPNLLKSALGKARLSGLTLKHFSLCLIRYFSRRASADGSTSHLIGFWPFPSHRSLYVCNPEHIHQTDRPPDLPVLAHYYYHGEDWRPNIQTFPLPFPSVSNLSRWVPPYLNNKNIIFWKTTIERFHSEYKSDIFYGNDLPWCVS